MWHWHQNHLSYYHLEDDDTLGMKIIDATRTSPITGDSPPVFPHCEESAENAETTASNFTLATDEILKGTCLYPLQDCRPSSRYSRVSESTVVLSM